MTRTTRKYDPWILGLALAATVLGLLFIFDAGYARALQTDGSGIPPEFKSQVLFLFIAGLGAWLASRIRIEKWKTLSKFVWIINLILLVLVLVAGHKLNGAKRWMGVGPLSIQPAEFAKLAAVIYLAAYFADRKAWPSKIKPQKNFGLRFDNVWVPKVKRYMPAIWVALSVILIEIEPDLGTGAVIAATAFAMFLPGGVSRKSIFAAILIASIGGAFAVYKEPYRLQRFIDHPNRWTTRNIDDTEFQTVQAELAISSGGVGGVGLGIGRAKHVLPATTTDFVMATVGEESGLWGSLGILAVLGGLVFRLLLLAHRAPSRFGMLVLYGVGAWLGIQTCVNMMMANAFLPAIGIPLPFISSGGSSLVALWLAIGVCQSALVPEPVKEEKPSKAKSPPVRDKWSSRTAQVPVYTTNYRGRLR